MTPAERLAGIVRSLTQAGITCLVMGGHAVRYYGLERYTNDFDLYLAVADWSLLPPLLAHLPGLASQPPQEGPTWRPEAFRRFQIGRLPDGREEWLEFWRDNHLLPPFAEVYARRELGAYGGQTLPFLCLSDLIRSKETERPKDWADVAVLEEFLDARNLAQATGEQGLVAALAGLRSVRGFESHLARGHFQRPELVTHALGQAAVPMAQALLLPVVPWVTAVPALPVPVEPVVLQRLRTVAVGSALHLALVEVVRRHYRQSKQAADRANKEAIFAAQTQPPPAG